MASRAAAVRTDVWYRIISPRQENGQLGKARRGLLASLGAGAGTVVDRARAFLEESAGATALHRHDLGDDGPGDLLGPLRTDVEPGRPVDPRPGGPGGAGP